MTPYHRPTAPEVPELIIKRVVVVYRAVSAHYYVRTVRSA
jgi:hypothetical protein